jgi:hypothetical protein
MKNLLHDTVKEDEASPVIMANVREAREVLVEV